MPLLCTEVNTSSTRTYTSFRSSEHVDGSDGTSIMTTSPLPCWPFSPFRLEKAGQRKQAQNSLNSLECTDNYSAILKLTWSWYTGRWWVRCYIWYSEEGTELGRSSPRPLLAVPTASVPITVLLYIGPLLCGFNVSIKGLTLYRVAPKTASVLWLLISAKRADWYVWFRHTSTAFCFEYSFNLIS